MKKARVLSLLLALVMGLSLLSPAAAAEDTTASVLKLTKTTGTVNVNKSSGKSIALRSDLRLYNGYHVTTGQSSYAWINLDDTKLLKEDAASEVEVRKQGKKLEVNLSAGNVFFDVSEKLDSDESLNISTSTMVAGIRGTSGWVEIESSSKSRLYVLDGSVQCTVSDPVTGQRKLETVKAGEMVECVVYEAGDSGNDRCDIIRQEFEAGEIPGSVLTQLVEDVPLCDRILEDSGMDVLAELAKTAGGDPGGRTPDGKSASTEVLGLAGERQKQDEAETAQKLDELQNTQREQDDEGLTENLWGGGKFTVTFDPNGGTVKPTAAVTGTDGTLTSLPGPTREGYTFNGWFTAAEGGSPVTAGTAFTQDAVVYAQWTQNSTAGNVTWRVEGTTLYIEGSGAMEDYASPGAVPWFDQREEITAIVIGGQVTHIGSNAFYYCIRLTGIDIPGGVTSIGSNAFTSCNNLTSVTIQKGVTSIGDSAFYNCFALSSVAIPEGVTSIGSSAFRECISLTRADLPSTVISIGERAFEDCRKLTSVTIPDGATSIGRAAFYNCDGLTNMTIPDSVTSIGSNVFTGCTGLTDITFGGTRAQWNTLAQDAGVPGSTTVHCMDDAPASDVGWYIDNGTLYITGSGPMGDYPYRSFPWYDQRNEITSIVIGSQITRIGDEVFLDCPNVASVTIPDSVTSIGKRAFEDCTNLAGVTIPSGVTSIGDSAFSGCYRLTSVTIPSGVTSIGESTFENCSNLTNVTIPDSVTSIGSWAFYDCSALTSLTIPDSVTSIGEYVFFVCDALTDIHFGGTIAQWNTLAANAGVPSGATVHCSDGDRTTT